MYQNVLVISAHVGDFVWRSGGTIAELVRQGAHVKLIILTYGLRGESNGYWKLPDANWEQAVPLRRGEGLEAARILGVAEVETWEYEDYPLYLDRERMCRLAAEIRRADPDLIITHDSQRDAFNTDHTLVGKAVFQACDMARSKAIDLEGLAPISKKPVVWGFEPHVPDLCAFRPGVFMDFSQVAETKRAAMEVYAATQKTMFEPYWAKATIRAAQSGIPGCTCAEAFSLAVPAGNG